MNVSQKIMAFRNERATELEAFARVLERNNLGKAFQIFDAAKTLRDETRGFHTPGTKDYACWGYTIEDLRFYFSEHPRHIQPDTVHTLEMIVDMILLSKCDDWSKLVDPFIELNFRVTIRGLDISSEYTFGFHIDRHDESRDTDEAHPIYHIQYDPAGNTNNDNFGKLLRLDTPRMMHAPVDIVLGLDLLFSNFFPKTWDALRNTGEYSTIHKKYWDSIWKPYVHSWASSWPYNNAGLNWNPILLCPYLPN